MNVQYSPKEPPVAAAPKRYRKWRRYPDGTLRHRLNAVRTARGPWYDWGHRVMAAVGRWDGTGDYSVPRGRDLYYRETGRRSFETSWKWDPSFADNDWHIFDVQNDGFEVHMGYYSGNFYYLTRAELKLFRHWDFWECRARAEWFGLRRWLYYKALHAAVNQKKPFACNATPAAGTGGYNHWHCELKRRHEGDHRIKNYTFSEVQS